MISENQRKKLEQKKPTKYRKQVVSFLKKKGIKVSESLVGAVYAGHRKNTVVAQAIVKVFNREHNKKIRNQKKIDQQLGIVN